MSDPSQGHVKQKTCSAEHSQPTESQDICYCFKPLSLRLLHSNAQLKHMVKDWIYMQVRPWRNEPSTLVSFLKSQNTILICPTLFSSTSDTNAFRTQHYVPLYTNCNLTFFLMSGSSLWTSVTTASRNDASYSHRRCIGAVGCNTKPPDSCAP